MTQERRDIRSEDGRGRRSGDRGGPPEVVALGVVHAQRAEQLGGGLRLDPLGDRQVLQVRQLHLRDLGARSASSRSFRSVMSIAMPQTPYTSPRSSRSGNFWT